MGRFRGMKTQCSYLFFVRVLGWLVYISLAYLKLTMWTRLASNCLPLPLECWD